MHPHIAEAMKQPDLVRVQPDLVCLRFETMKIYSALGAVRHLLDSGAVRPGDTLIDSSSGIYAQALALACHRYGLHCHIVGSTTVDRTLRVQLEILGVTLEQVEPSQNLRLDQELRVRRISEILKDNPSYHWMRQYHDEIHYYGYRGVAGSLDREIPAGAVTLVGGVGSGASTGALATYLREAGRDVSVVGVQPFGSVTFGSEHVSDPDMIIAGIGSAIAFRNVRHALYDRIHWVNFECALSGSVELLRSTGIFAGLSSGAAYLTTLWERSRRGPRTYVFIAADTGHRYVDSAFAQHHRAQDIDALSPHEITSLDELRHPWSTASWPDVSASRHGS
ncbi:pyridoxal-phosphate dependent enzyme [Streptomyces nanshensis]|uniref:Cysteine synthase n=1 Tax=Streptomyces nanshensis TaxID=518642 RepID=A0A1E7L4Z1_9ACTN|nr:pyridoxal-phosphate dependent enzyme [Streptomyces nanshensis]OEV11267.1 cysteine synthase [Streptomyces nanshensis]